MFKMHTRRNSDGDIFTIKEASVNSDIGETYIAAFCSKGAGIELTTALLET